jgi:hypothetical protein
MVFLFPLVLEGSEDPWRESFRRTRQAGGTFPVLGRVLVVAFYMVTGGIFRWGLRRSWCVGCLAVLVWYLDLKEGKTHGLA